MINRLLLINRIKLLKNFELSNLIVSNNQTFSNIPSNLIEVAGRDGVDMLANIKNKTSRHFTQLFLVFEREQINN